ncbi:hypothetical protein [Yinghuangia aomiensis]|uniref:hypothetical protein n=1 Tax=Yinghuangia aomiensis TaxID=676205 RepID=UPI0031E8D8DE
MPGEPACGRRRRGRAAIGDATVLHYESFPTATGWAVRAANTDNGRHAIVAEVLCAAP